MIDNRLNLVETFLHDVPLRENMIRLLQKSHDSQRIVQKFSLGRGDADDLIALARTIEVTRGILELLSSSQTYNDKADSTGNHRESMEVLLKKLSIPSSLAKRITDSIDEEGLMQQQRMEESEKAEMAQMARTAIGLEEEDEEIKTGTEASRKSQKTKTGKGHRIVSHKDAERQQAWVMQKRFEKPWPRERMNKIIPFLSQFTSQIAYPLLCSRGGHSPPSEIVFSVMTQCIADAQEAS